jgi:hypothetical protein
LNLLKKLRVVLEKWIVDTDDQERVFEPSEVAAREGRTKVVAPENRN